MQSTPAEIRSQRPDIKYLLVRVRDFSVLEGDTAYLVDSNPIAREFLMRDTPPEGYTLLQTVRDRIDADGTLGVFVRLFKVEPPTDPNGRMP